MRGRSRQTRWSGVAEGEHLLHEVLEQRQMVTTMTKQLRVPLHAQHRRSGIDLDCFDLALVVVGDRPHACTKAIDDLMVQ